MLLFCNIALPYPAEDFHRWAGHVYVIVIGAPVQIQITAGQMSGAYTLGSSSKRSGYAARARSGSAG